MIDLKEKLYSSTEVADILGVSLRSVYRYIEEEKLKAEVKTATGRHRFTKQNIVDFLYPNGEPKNSPVVFDTVSEDEEVKAVKPSKKVGGATVKKQEKEVEAVAEESSTEEGVGEKVGEPTEEPVDWLAKFREAAKRFEAERAAKEETVEEQAEPVVATKSTAKQAPVQVQEPEVESSITGFASEEVAEEQSSDETKFYYRSRLGGLKDIAQNVDKSAKNAGVDYAFTMNAGLSLFKPIKPFSVLHVYARRKDKEFFERSLMLMPSDEVNAQLCILISDDNSVYSKKVDMHGLSVVSKNQLYADIADSGDAALLQEAQGVLK